MEHHRVAGVRAHDILEFFVLAEGMGQELLRLVLPAIHVDYNSDTGSNNNKKSNRRVIMILVMNLMMILVLQES